MTRPLRVFLCHASQDKPAVWEVHRFLKQHGVQPWLDEADLLPGQHWEVEIPKAINTSDVILVCLSKNSINKEGYVQKEIVFALDKALEKPEGTIFIIPLKLEECDVPGRLSPYQWVDYYRPEGRKRLLMGLNKRVAELGSDVLPVILEDTRQKKNATKPVSSDLANRDVVEASLEMAEKEAIEKAILQNVARETAEKAKLERLVLEAKEKSKDEAAERKVREKREREIKEMADLETRRKKQKEFFGRITNLISSNSRLLGIGGITLMVLIFGGFGLNYLLKNLPVATATVSSPKATITIKPPTLTSVPITSTPQPTKTPIPTPNLGIGSTMIGEKGETLVYVSAGEFTMGDDSSDAPVHTVYLDAFWIDQTEVTNKQYQTCVEAGVCESPFTTISLTHSNYYGNPEFDNYPVIYVNWDKANRYCEVWAGGDLPTEAQWEKAARGIDARTYPWGNDAPRKDLLNSNGYIGDTTMVKNYPNTASFYETYDMAGNVWEWVNDWYDETYYQSLKSSKNPLGPESGYFRAMRGGSWWYSDSFARSANRGMNTPTVTVNDIGFRCARSP